ncbi:MAG: hypothetical protein ACREFE_19555 [Limisphaerales bacterium]
MQIKFQWVAICLVLFFGYASLGDDSGVTLQTGGTQIVLSTGWEKLNQPENFFVQARARNIDRKIAISAGAFKLDLSVNQYVALGICGLEQGNAEKAIEQGAKLAADLAHTSVEEVQKALQSEIGQQMLAQIKNQSTLYSIKFLSATNLEISSTSVFEIHSKMTILKSQQIVFSRQFIYQGAEPQQIVQITFASPSKDIFQDKNLIDAIKVH